VECSKVVLGVRSHACTEGTTVGSRKLHERTAMSQVPFTTRTSAACVNGAGYRCTTKRWVLRRCLHQARRRYDIIRSQSQPISASAVNSSGMGTFQLMLERPDASRLPRTSVIRDFRSRLC
jgi:hypothetical protein